MVLLMYRHGLRVCELLDLKWNQINLRGASIHIIRHNNGTSVTHPLSEYEVRSLRVVRRQYPESSYVFNVRKKFPMSHSRFHKILLKAGQEAGLGIPLHPFMLRHSTGYKLAGDGHDICKIQNYLGHKYIQHTKKYTEIRKPCFKDFWSDI